MNEEIFFVSFLVIFAAIFIYGIIAVLNSWKDD
jgi:hypothetical protein